MAPDARDATFRRGSPATNERADGAAPKNAFASGAGVPGSPARDSDRTILRSISTQAPRLPPAPRQPCEARPARRVPGAAIPSSSRFPRRTPASPAPSYKRSVMPYWCNICRSRSCRGAPPWYLRLQSPRWPHCMDRLSLVPALRDLFPWYVCWARLLATATPRDQMIVALAQLLPTVPVRRAKVRRIQLAYWRL